MEPTPVLAWSIAEVKSTVEAFGDVVHASGSENTRRDLDDVVVEFMDRLGGLKARMSGEGFASRDHVLNIKALVSDYLSAKKVPNAGCFWDLFSVLACMSPKRQQGKEKADETFSAKQINSSQLDNNLLVAMTHKRPGCFVCKESWRRSWISQRWLRSPLSQLHGLDHRDQIIQVQAYKRSLAVLHCCYRRLYG